MSQPLTDSHTPRPWRWETSSELETRLVDANGETVLGLIMAMLPDDVCMDVSTPDADLIAAAPDLLEALEATLDWLPHWGEGEGPKVLERARAAIAKARGEA